MVCSRYVKEGEKVKKGVNGAFGNCVEVGAVWMTMEQLESIPKDGGLLAITDEKTTA